MITYTNGEVGTVKTVTVRTMEYDDNGNLVKETETITEYEKAQVAPFVPYQQPPYQYPLVTYTC